jgi:hypothetical protein
MGHLHFYPLGNADSTLIHLNDGRLILKDYFTAENRQDGDKRIDLERELREYLRREKRDDIDAVAFSHCDDDHCHGADAFFWLDHARTYQSGGRIKMRSLWVPACFIFETGLVGTARAIQAEARYRFKKGYGIRVFGNPGPLEQWLRDQDIDPSTRSGFIVMAGTCVPSFDRATGNVEIFSHSPFSYRMEGEEVDRNGNCLVWHMTFFEAGAEMRCLLGADAEHQTWVDMVFVTKKKGNYRRLDWDLFRTSHHCSYTALSAEKGMDETVPREQIESLFDRGSDSCILIASCDPIPAKDTDQPPHRQAAKYYRRKAREKGDEKNFIVTMEWPDREKPKPIVVETTPYGFKASRRAAAAAGAAVVIASPSPRFG